MSGPGRSSTWVWTVLAVLAALAVVWQQRTHENAPAHEHEHDEHAVEALPFLWASGTEDLAAVELLHAGGRLRYERDKAGAWLLHRDHAPTAGEHAHRAEQRANPDLGATLDTFSRTRTERRLPADAEAKGRFGLATPELIVLLFDRAGAHKLTVEVGELAADGLARYVHVPAAAGGVHDSDYQIRGLRGLIERAAS
ncbi:MAG: hypothetical protein R3E83_23080 [Burkholderiaceae bacterium]